MHNIQRRILAKLVYEPWLTYAQMRPSGVESNHFAYHLDQLVRAGLIEKSGRKYSLTKHGLSLADRVSHDNMTIRQQPHIVTSVHVTNEAGKCLLYKHAFQPYLGLYSPPQGRIHYEDQSIAHAARRELAEKTGLTGVALTQKGMAYVHATKDGASISKILIHVFVGRVQGAPQLTGPTNKGACSWGSATRLKASQCMPGFKKIQRLLKANKPGLFFAEITEELPQVVTSTV